MFHTGFCKGFCPFHVICIYNFRCLSMKSSAKTANFTISLTLKCLCDILFPFLPRGTLNFRWSHSLFTLSQRLFFYSNHNIFHYVKKEKSGFAIANPLSELVCVMIYCFVNDFFHLWPYFHVTIHVELILFMSFHIWKVFFIHTNHMF